MSNEEELEGAIECIISEALDLNNCSGLLKEIEHTYKIRKELIKKIETWDDGDTHDKLIELKEEEEIEIEEKFEHLLGKVVKKIVLQNKDACSDDQLIFTMEDGEKYKLYHKQVCCEQIYLNDVCGDLSNLCGEPILQAAEESFTSVENETWTFYKLSTIKGSVTLRWIGTSNGYYSEAVDFIRIRRRGN